jgi:hypothetical protein
MIALISIGVRDDDRSKCFTTRFWRRSDTTASEPQELDYGPGET